MIASLLTLVLLVQGIPVKPSESGTITGTLKTELGAPAAGVRVAAMALPESAAIINSASALTSLAETDSAGYFRLENIPQGRYYITAGRVDYPTYYPGTQEITAGRIVTVKPGDSIPGMDFAMNSVAVRPAPNSFGIATTPTLGIVIQVSVEGGGMVPVFSAAGFTTLRLEPSTGGGTTTIQLTASSMGIAIPAPAVAPEYRIKVENLPDGYVVHSIRYNATDVTNGTFKLSTTAIPATGTISMPFNSLSTGTILVASSAQLPGPVLSIALTKAQTSLAGAAGVRITGKAKNAEIRSVYISGTPGTFFADGSFEFRGVLPGRQSISTPDNPSSSQPLAATVVVGNQDLSGVELHDTPVLPINVISPAPPGPAGTHAPGSIVTPAFVRGRVLDETTHEPIVNGIVFLTGHYGSSVQLDANGRFEFPRLIPGRYQMEIHPFGHVDIRRIIVVGEEDVQLDLATPEGEGLIQ